MFAAGGNDRYKNRIGDPACLTSTIAVGAVYDADVGTRDHLFDCTDEETGADIIPCWNNMNQYLDILQTIYRRPQHDFQKSKICKPFPW